MAWDLVYRKELGTIIYTTGLVYSAALFELRTVMLKFQG